MKKPKKPTIGPATKKQAKKAAPKVPMTPARTAEVKKKKRKDTMIGIGAAIGTAAGAIASEIRSRRTTAGLNKWRQENYSEQGPTPTNKELRKMGRGGLKKTK